MRAKTFGTTASALRACIVGLLLVGLVCGAAAADKAITKLDVVNKPDRVIIDVQANCALSMVPLVSSKGNYLGFQFPCKMTAKGGLTKIGSGRIYSVRYCNFKPNPPTSRVVANTSAQLNYSTDWSADKHRVRISVWKYGVKKPATEPASSTSPSAAQPLVDEDFRPLPVKSTPARVTEVSEPTTVSSVVAEHAPKGSDPSGAAEPELKSELKARDVARLAPAQQPVVYEGKKISLNFLGADIHDVLKALSVQSGENIVAAKDVSGQVTVSLTDVTVEEALDYIVRLSSYNYAKDKGTYLVGTKESLQALLGGDAGTSKVEVVAMHYASMEDTMAFLKNEYPGIKVTPSGGSKGDKASGAAGGLLVLSGSADLVDRAKSLVAQIDGSVQELRGGTKTEVYRIKHVNPHEMVTALTSLVPDVQVDLAPSDGFDLTAPEAVTLGSSSTGGGSTVQRTETKTKTDEIGWVQALVISGPAVSVDRALELAAKLDVKSPQIKIDAKVTSLTETGEKELGLSWEWSPIQWLEGTLEVPNDFLQIGEATERWHRQPFDFGAKLDSLIKEGEGELLAAPSMVCMEGKPGLFFVGDEVRYITLVQVTPTGTNVTTETANVGVQLRVAGDVSPDGYITLNLHPEVSVLQLEKDQETGITLPIITRRFTDHVVRVKSGETIVIGGLIRDEELDVLNKVPILGDLPILGKLFRHKSKTKNHSEVVMFITAAILED